MLRHGIVVLCHVRQLIGRNGGSIGDELCTFFRRHAMIGDDLAHNILHILELYRLVLCQQGTQCISNIGCALESLILRHTHVGKGRLDVRLTSLGCANGGTRRQGVARKILV